MAVFVDLDGPSEDDRTDANNNHQEGKPKSSESHPPNMPGPIQASPSDPAPMEVSAANNTLQRVLSIYPYVFTRTNHPEILFSRA